MQVRRERTEHLRLVGADGATVELATASRNIGGALASQDELAVSPDGAYLAWTSAEDDRLHLRDAEGHERILARYGRRMRFSPDGKWLAAFTDVGRGDWKRLVAWELATGHVQSLMVADVLDRFEWVPDGLVVAQHDALLHVPLAGDQRRVFEVARGEHLRRFAVAPNGSRVVVVLETERGPRVRSFELDHPERVRELGALPGDIENLEISPDGKRVVLATTKGLFVVDGDGAPRELSGRRDVHSLWFAADGRLAYAAPTSVTVLVNKTARRLEPRNAVAMMRFDKESSGVLVATVRDVRAWDPATDRQTVLASAPQGEDLLGAEHFKGGIVLWTGYEHHASPARRTVRLLRLANGTTTELDRIEGDRAASATYGIDRSFATSTDGRSFLYRELADGRVHVQRGGVERVFEPGTELSPSGAQVLIIRDVDRESQSWSLADTASGVEHHLFDQKRSDATGNVAFSPDGRWLALTRKQPDDQIALVLFEAATGTEHVLLTAKEADFAWTARGLVVQRPEGLALVSTKGELRPLLDESVEPGLATVLASADGHRAFVCFRGGTDGIRAHPGLLSIDLDAPKSPVELDISNCWNRWFAMSPDGEQVSFTTFGGSATTTDAVSVTSTRGDKPARQLGEGYTGVTFDRHGGLAFVSHRGLRFSDGHHDELFETDGPIESVQFTANGTLRFAIGREVIEWNPLNGSRTVLARAPEGQRILAVVAVTDGFLIATVSHPGSVPSNG